MFEDESFSCQKIHKNIIWLRPFQICSNPKFIEKITRFDVNQGNLEDCWFMAAMACLAQHKKLFDQVVIDKNFSFFDKAYSGSFQFRFWYFGSWTTIVIDDRLPTINGKLVFVHSRNENEFWPALLEKAYAKLHGGYEFLKFGIASEAFSNLTGGVTEVYDLKNPPNDFYNMLQKATHRNTLMGAGKFKTSHYHGLTGPHAYSITDISHVNDIYGRIINLIRIRNPYGDDFEYTGDWSDSSRKWDEISTEEKERINFNINGDGEFWMSFKDFLEHFDMLEICNLSPDMMTREPCKGRKWKLSTFQEVWKRNASNMHEFEATDPDPDDDDDFCTIVVAIMYINKNRKVKNRLGLRITSSPDKYALQLEKPNKYAYYENVFRFDLLPGKYQFEVLSYDKQDDFEYLFRIFYERKEIKYPIAHYTAPTCTIKEKVKHIKYYAQKKDETAGFWTCYDVHDEL